MASTETDRRTVLKVVLASGAAALCASAVAPPIAFVVAPRGGAPGARWVKTVKLDELPEDRPRKVKIVSDERDAWKLEKDAELGAVWLVRNGDAVRALSVVCPHLGCSIDASGEGKGFACPCHDSSFDPSGKRETGPSPRDMDALETRVVDGVVEVDFRRFRQGIPERIQVA
jgi:cytochrome b6-f complex iron-sulfur subunit/menaquinol-cytochrome c reductase iron-sulfur subunit